MTSSSTEKEVHIFKRGERKWRQSQRWCLTRANSPGRRRDGPVNAIRMRDFSNLYNFAAKAGPDVLQPSDETE